MRNHSHERSNAASQTSSACRDCPAAAGRRAFLRDIALGVAALLVADTGSASAMRFADSVAEIGSTHAAKALRTYAIPSTDSVSIDVGSDLILVRWQGRVYAFSLRCPHRGTRLEWLATERRLFCPKHKARFQADGQHDTGRRSRDLDRYAITRNGAAVAVDLDTIYRVDTNPEDWRAAFIGVG